MKVSAVAVLAVATGVMADAWSKSVDYVTETVDVYTTYCPEATTVSWGSSAYTVTEATTLTFQGPWTITKPVTTSSVVICNTCGYNGTWATATTSPTWTPTPAAVTPVVTAGAGKAAMLSGAGLAGVLGLAVLL